MNITCPACDGSGIYLGKKCCICDGCGVDHISKELIMMMYRNGDLEEKTA